jgi:predicted alpha/beta hydrolase family esterase
MTDLLHRFDFLLLPCRDNAGPDHWQSHWQAALPHMTRVEQDEWVSPEYAPWAARLDDYVARAWRPIVLIAHSLGTSLIMHWALTADTSRIAGAFMVAPSDRGPADIWPDAAKSGFAPMVLRPLPFPAMVLASQNDPYVAFDRAKLFAAAWRATLVDMGQSGHMGNAAGLGLWPEGLVHFGVFLGALDA